MHPKSNEALDVALFGASPDTGNMGVSALYSSFLHAMGTRLPGLRPVVFDNGLGLRNDTFDVGTRRMPILRFGARGGRRYHRPENLRTMAALSSFRAASSLHRGLSLIDSCSAVMDVSGGDSFSDIYGPDRFRNVVLPKFIAVRRSRRLLLLPQTYGPFKDPRHREQARRAVLGAGQAWSRDLRSHEILKDLLGADFDPKVHRTGVDMAFGLQPEKPSPAVLDPLADWLDSPTRFVGINISGLCWGLDGGNARQFGFKADYRALLRRLVTWILDNSGVNVLLIPHVFQVDANTMTDTAAATDLVASLDLDEGKRRRLRVSPDIPNERQVKWLISQSEWFCGTRMHATIAGLSSGVPTASIAYSDKTRGVFETCDQGSQIVDPRHGDTDRCLEQLQEIFTHREERRRTLAEALASLKTRLGSQMDDIAKFAVARA